MIGLLTLEAWMVLSSAIVVAGFAQGTAGFGFGITAMAILASVMPTEEAVPIVSLLSIAINGMLAFKLRKSLSFKKTWPLLGGAVLGIPLGVVFLARVNAHVVMAALGIVMIAFGVRGWRKLRHPEAASSGTPSRPRAGWMAGIFGGVLGGAFTTAGPPAVMYLATQPWERDVVRASLHVYFCAASVAAVVGYFYFGMLCCHGVTTAMSVAPVIPIGAWLGLKLGSRINPVRFRKVMMIGLTVMGLVFLTRALL